MDPAIQNRVDIFEFTISGRSDRSALDKNRNRLFFSESSGFKFLIDENQTIGDATGAETLSEIDSKVSETSSGFD